LTSSLTENIQNIAVEDTRIWTGCEYIYNLYDNGKEAGYYTSNGHINELLVTHLTRDNDFDIVFACQDKYIRIVHGSSLFMEIPVNFPATAVAHLELEKDTSVASRRPGYLVYGTSKGSVGLVQVMASGTYEHLWEIDDGDKRSAVNAIKLFDINKDEVAEIIIGRDDGRVEVFKLQPENILMEPTKVFSRDLGQSIRAVDCGVVSTADYAEIVVAVYSGKVISFTTEPIKTRAQEDTYGRSIQTVNNENRIKSLRKEVDEIKKKVEKEREKLKKANITSAATSNLIKPPADFPVNSKFELDPSVAAYILSIELQMSIDLIIIRSPVVLDLVEADTGSSVLSVTPPHLMQSTGGNDDSAGKYVAVFRCQAQERRISLTLRTNEGEFGEMMITIVAASNPKAAKIIKYELKPLSLHAKLHSLSSEELARPRNRIKYSGRSCTFLTCFLFCLILYPYR
jgi:Bardet-Biedl syndrome 7 protein